MLSSLADEHPTIALISADGGYTNSVDASLIDWADQELGIRLEIVTRGDDVTGFHALPRRWWWRERSARGIGSATIRSGSATCQRIVDDCVKWNRPADETNTRIGSLIDAGMTPKPLT